MSIDKTEKKMRYYGPKQKYKRRLVKYKNKEEVINKCNDSIVSAVDTGESLPEGDMFYYSNDTFDSSRYKHIKGAYLKGHVYMVQL